MERHPDSASSPGFRADPAQAPAAPRRNWLHRLVNVVVAIVVLAVAAGMFVFSYPGIHAIARQGGVSGQLARFYPALFDAVLVIACVAAVMLRDARWWARCWAWLVAIVILGAIGTTDVLHAMSYGLRQRPTEGVVAAAPVAAVLLAFSLFLTMLRQTRPQAPDAAVAPGPADRGASDQPTAPMMFSNVETIPALAAGTAPRPSAPAIALPAGPRAADQPTLDWPTDDRPVNDWPTDDRPTDDVRHEPVVIAETPEAAPTQARPALATDAADEADEADAADADQDPDADAVVEEPVSTVTAAETTAAETTETEIADNETANVEHPPTVEHQPVEHQPVEQEPVDHQPPTAAVVWDPMPEPTPTPTPRAEPTDDVSDEDPGEAEVSDETEPQPEPAPATAPHAIRYASSAAAEQFGDEDWEAEVDPALAGQVYPVLTSDPDIEVPPHQPGQSQDLEDDAPPFVTAPFASVPRLNRVRVTPTPPTDDGDADEE